MPLTAGTQLALALVNPLVVKKFKDDVEKAMALEYEPDLAMIAIDPTAKRIVKSRPLAPGNPIRMIDPLTGLPAAIGLPDPNRPKSASDIADAVIALLLDVLVPLLNADALAYSLHTHIIPGVSPVPVPTPMPSLPPTA